jgi:DNA end-binding protein Ku
MQQLHYADEVRPISEVPVGDAELKEAEVKLATQLIDQIASDEFKPEKYEDGARKSLQDAIQRKVEGREVAATPEQPRGQIIDLMEALKASLGAKEAGAAAPAAAPAEERKPARRAPRTAKKRAAGGEQATG